MYVHCNPPPHLHTFFFFSGRTNKLRFFNENKFFCSLVQGTYHSKNELTFCASSLSGWSTNKITFSYDIPKSLDFLMFSIQSND